MATNTPAPPSPLIYRGLSADLCQRYEPNDTLSTAWGPLANGQAIEAALYSGDPDDYYYSPFATDNSAYSFRLAPNVPYRC